MIALPAGLLSALLAILASSTAPFDSERAPTPRVTAGGDGTVYFRMLPRQGVHHDGFGRAYRVGVDGDELLWEVDGWFAFQTFLSRDGRHLVRLGNWPRGRAPSPQHLAVAFYRDGELLRSWSTRALIRDDSKVLPTVSHYAYRMAHGALGFTPLPDAAPWSDDGFTLTTVDGIRYTFDRRSGEIVASEQVDGPSRAERDKALVRRFYEHVYSTGAIDELPDYVASDYAELLQGERHEVGLAGAREHLRGVRRVYPDLRLTVEQQVVEGEWVVSRLTMRGTHGGEWQDIPPTGERVTVTAVNLDRVRDGRIVEHGGAANLLGPLLQAGAIRPAARAP